MFTNEELEDCPNEIFEDWLNSIEHDINSLLEDIKFQPSMLRYDHRRRFVQFMFKAYDQKRCPYA